MSQTEEQRREEMRKMIAEEQARQSKMGAQQRGDFKPSEFDPPGFKG